MYKRCFKRWIDVFLSLCGIIALAIPMLVVAVIIKIDSPGPALFRQKRIGKCKKQFYITPVGRFIRRTSIDELPQLFCILKGDMSVVGPRPALWNQYDLIEERDKYGANDIKPGLTGWAQINGRDELPIDVKAQFDGEYVKKMSFRFDCKCFWRTILRVLRRDGVLEDARE